MRSKKKHKYELQSIILIILIIATICVIGTGVIKDKEEVLAQSVVQAQNKEAKQQLKKEGNYDLYGKIENNKNISTLVIGDSIGASNGADSGKEWFNTLNNWFLQSYKINETIKQIVHSGGGINDGIQEYESDKETGYDLILLCYGDNDRAMNIDGWSKKYEYLVRELIEKNPKSEVVLLIESSFLNGENQISIPDRIKKIADYYDLEVIDMRDVFKNSGKEYSKLSGDGIHPNNDGYYLYFKGISELLNQNIKNDKTINYKSKDKLFN